MNPGPAEPEADMLPSEPAQLRQECVGIGGQVGMQLKIVTNMMRGGVRKLVYDTDRPAILKEDLVGLHLYGDW